MLKRLLKMVYKLLHKTDNLLYNILHPLGNFAFLVVVSRLISHNSTVIYANFQFSIFVSYKTENFVQVYGLSIIQRKPIPLPCSCCIAQIKINEKSLFTIYINIKRA